MAQDPKFVLTIAWEGHDPTLAVMPLMKRMMIVIMIIIMIIIMLIIIVVI